MKRFCLVLLAIAAALAITPAALAGTLCPNQATPGGDGTGTFTKVAGPLDGTSCGVSDTAVTMSITNVQNYAKLTWNSSNSGYPGGLDLGNLGGVAASVTNSGAGQPYYELAFTDPGDSFLDTTTHDQILLIEFQPTTISGGNMAINPSTTLFNLYDNTLNEYLEAPGGVPGASGQQNAKTLDAWLLLDPSLSSDAITELRLAIGMAGGSGLGESLTVDSVDVTETPEPSSLLLLGTGLLGLAFLAFRKAKSSGVTLSM